MKQTTNELDIAQKELGNQKQLFETLQGKYEAITQQN